MLDFSFSGFMSGLLFSTIGLWVLQQSRKRGNNKTLVIGLLLMLYSIVTSGPLQDWGVGFALCYAAHYFWDRF